MKVLVTGGCGFIGSVICEKLIEAGHHVCVLDNLSSGKRENIHPGCSFYEADIANPFRFPEAFQAAFQHQDAVIHCAAYAEVDGDARKCVDSNVVGSINVLNQMRYNGCNHMIFSSSAAVYGDNYLGTFQETDPCRPCNVYGQTKLMFEDILHWYWKHYDLKYTTFRYFNVVGATKNHGENRRRETHLIANVLHAVRTGDPVNIFGTDYKTPDGTAIRDYVHVKDIAEAHIKALNSATGIYNLGSGIGYSVRQVIDTAVKVIGRDIKTNPMPRRIGDPIILVAETDRARALLHWQPKHDLESMIRSTWEWMQ